MKKIFTLLVFTLLASLPAAFAGAGLFEYFFDTKFNGTPKTHGNYAGGTSLDGSVLATGVVINQDALIIDLPGLKSWQDNGDDVSSARANYRIYLQGGTPGSFIAHNLPFFAQAGNNKEWQNAADIDLLAGITAPGTYVLEVYFDATSTAGALYNSNNSNNYKATFVVASVLPVSLQRFDAQSTKNSVLLNWNTSSESNSSHFEVEKSLDGKNWRTIGSAEAAGYSRELVEYQFEDATVNTVAYYRLRMVDLDESFEYSRVLTMKKDMKNTFIMSPNPATDAVRLVLNDATTNRLHVKVYNLTGRLICTGDVDNNGLFNVSHLSSDIYFLSINDEYGQILAQERLVKD